MHYGSPGVNSNTESSPSMKSSLEWSAIVYLMGRVDFLKERSKDFLLWKTKKSDAYADRTFYPFC